MTINDRYDEMMEKRKKKDREGLSIADLIKFFLGVPEKKKRYEPRVLMRVS